MKTARRPPAPTESDRGRSVAAIASRRQCGGGSRSLRGGTGIPWRSSLPIQMRSSGSGTRQSFLEPRERLAHQGPYRGGLVPALLEGEGGGGGPREPPAGRPEAGGRDGER